MARSSISYNLSRDVRAVSSHRNARSGYKAESDSRSQGLSERGEFVQCACAGRWPCTAEHSVQECSVSLSGTKLAFELILMRTQRPSSFQLTRYCLYSATGASA